MATKPFTIQVHTPTTTARDTRTEGRLAVDVIPSQGHIHIVAPVAGIDTASLDIHIHNDVLTIRGDRPMPEILARADMQYHQECFWGPFSRTIVLPTPVIAEKAAATLSGGVLQIDIPKRDTDRMIPITIVEE